MTRCHVFLRVTNSRWSKIITFFLPLMHLYITSTLRLFEVDIVFLSKPIKNTAFNIFFKFLFLYFWIIFWYQMLKQLPYWLISDAKKLSNYFDFWALSNVLPLISINIKQHIEKHLPPSSKIILLTRSTYNSDTILLWN